MTTYKRYIVYHIEFAQGLTCTICFPCFFHIIVKAIGGRGVKSTHSCHLGSLPLSAPLDLKWLFFPHLVYSS